MTLVRTLPPLVACSSKHPKVTERYGTKVKVNFFLAFLSTKSCGAEKLIQGPWLFSKEELFHPTLFANLTESARICVRCMDHPLDYETRLPLVLWLILFQKQ